MNKGVYYFKGVLFVGLLFSTGLVNAQISDFYSESVSGRAGFSGAPNEIIDPFTGTLNIVHNDVVIPGNGGLDIRVQRVYSSQNVYYKNGTQNTLNTLQSRQPVGQGWIMHFGRIRMPKSSNPCAAAGQQDITNNPTVELQDGSQQILFCNDYASTYDTNAEFVTKGNGVADYLNPSSTLNGFSYIDSNGVKYTMDYRLDGGIGQFITDDVWYATRIEDGNGNYLTITYYPDSDREAILIKRIQSSDGRAVDFTYFDSTNADKARLATVKHSTQTWTYSYQTVTDYQYQSGTTQTYYLLTKVDFPGTNTGDWEYDYYNRADGVAGDRLIEEVTHPFGGTTTYDYEYHCFMYTSCSSSSQYNSLVVKSKVNGGRSITAGTWNFAYSESTTYDTTTITGPTSKEIYKHYGMLGFSNRITGSQPTYTNQIDDLWRTGLLVEKKIQTTSGSTLQTEEYDYSSRKISDEYYSRYPYTSSKKVSDYGVYAGYLTESRIIRDGKTYTTKYENFTDNLNPHKITEIGQSTRVTTLDYYPRSDGQNIVSQVDDEQYSGSTNRKITRTFDGNGNLKTKTRYGVLSTYGYDSQGNVTSVKDARNKITSYGSYYRGVPRVETQPESVSIARTVDTFGNIKSVNNGRNYTTNFTYDSLNRLKNTTYPFGSASSVTWGSTGQTLTRGGYTQIITVDGFGRTICTKTENIYVGEAYDAVGNRTYETYPNYTSCTDNTRTSFTYDALNRLKRSTHPDTKYTEITYQNNNVQRLRDERGSLFYSTYRSYASPDQQELISMTGPEALSLAIGRNDIGQVTSINRNGVNRTYNYGTSIFLLSETNPETGTTTYGRDAVGNMTSKKVGTSGTTNYTYDDLNRLELTNYPSGTPDVTTTYDKNSNVQTIDSSIADITYTYDPNDNLTKEQQNIDGDNYFLTYNYTSLDHLNSITYADGGLVTYSPNDLGWPTKASPYVSSVSYDAFGRPTTLDYANGRSQTQSYWTRGWPRRTIVNGSVSDRERTYDSAGNLIDLNDRLNNLYDRTMTYDGLNRLDTTNGAWGNGSVNYSTDDDITSKTMGSRSLSYGYSSANNRISSVSGLENFSSSAQYGYDVYGNIANKSNSSFGWTYDYDDASNLRQVFDNNSVLLRSYDYSGLKQRVKSVKTDETRIHIVSKAGQLMNEFVTTGTKPNIANVYLGSRLVAELESQMQPVPEPTIFGYGYGNNDHKDSYSTSFTLDKIPDTLRLCMDGYGISYATEVSVKVNGTLVGYMNPGGDPTQTCFDLTGSQLQLGSNTVLFSQAVSGQLWGVGIIQATAMYDGGFIPAIIMLLLGEEI